jgi:hypothetical protein
MLGNELVNVDWACVPNLLPASLTQIDDPMSGRSLVWAHGFTSRSQSRSEQFLSLIPRHRVIIFRVD